MITYIEGDLFEKMPDGDNITRLVCHVTNDIPIMGSGFALGLITKYPIVKEKNKCTTLGINEIIHIHPHLMVVNMTSQHKTIREVKKPIRYKSLVECMVGVADRVQQLKPYADRVEIHAPRFGSDRAKGNFAFITELIEELWSDIPVFIYSYKEEK